MKFLNQNNDGGAISSYIYIRNGHIFSPMIPIFSSRPTVSVGLKITEKKIEEHRKNVQYIY
jgi:hypothetical protein